MSTTAVIFGGPSPEHDISILTGLQCERVLTDAGQDVVPIYWGRTGGWHLVPNGGEAKDYVDGPPSGAKDVEPRLGAAAGFYAGGGLRGAKKIAVDAVLNCCHGGPGERGLLNGLLDLMGIPATGGPAGAAELGMDKLAFGTLLEAHGLPTLQRRAITPDTKDLPFGGPYIVKPRFGGSSIGIEVVEDLGTARDLVRAAPALRLGAVVEPFVKGAVDLNLGFRTWPHFSSSLLERPLRPEDGEIYDYKAKYLGGAGLVSAPREIPAKVDPAIEAEARELAETVATLTGIQGLCRVDFLVIDGVLHVNEINTIPGAMGLYLWPNEVSYAELLTGAVAEAVANKPVFDATGADGTALRVAGGIAGKLMR
ncbi:hypothetical protein ACIB24_04980 [Spongisporangium articulatum]|uniref:ATP-grasp domain-containing protein n=1 Tax=Spongisporangium articulatum TaxID=3362603 RepID=A0ABW8AJ64_9ACTN